MDCLAHTWTCSACSRQHVGIPALPPPDWEWHGSRLLCEDCGNSPPPSRPPEGLLEAAEAVLSSTFAEKYRLISPYKELAAAVAEERKRVRVPKARSCIPGTDNDCGTARRAGEMS